jgi:hypothetical protein
MQQLFLVVFEIFLLEGGFEYEFFNAGFVLRLADLGIQLFFALYPPLYLLQFLLLLDGLGFALLRLANLCDEFYLFEQNLALLECLLYFELLIVVELLFLLAILRLFESFEEGGRLLGLTDNLGAVERRDALLGSERFLRFALHFLQTVLGEFVLMVLQMHLELLLRLEVLAADVALYQTTHSDRLPDLKPSDRLLIEHG